MIVVGNIYAGLNPGGGGGGVTTLDNGLTLVGTNGVLGGTPLKQDTAIDTTGFNLFIGEPSQNLGVFIAQAARSLQLNGLNGGGVTGGFGALDPTQLLLTFFLAGVEQALSFTGASMAVTDNVNSKGLVYAADYSVVGITDPRWIPDYGAVVALLSGNTTIYSGDGTLAGNRVVNVAARSLTFSGVNGGNQRLALLLDDTAGGATISMICHAAGTEVAAVTIQSGGGAPTIVEINVVDAAGLTQDILMEPGSFAIGVTDSIGNKGFAYDNDYSVNGLQDDLWVMSLGGARQVFPYMFGGTAKAIVNAINASLNLVTYVDTFGNSMYRVSVTTNMLSGVGTLVTSMTYTDIGGNAHTVAMDTIAAVGGTSPSPKSILVQAATNISLDVVVTGTAVGAIGYAIEHMT